MSERAPDPAEPPWRVSVTDALVQASRELPADQFVACVDSALHEGTLSRAGLPRLRSLLKEKDRWLLDLVDAAAESGLESLGRVRLTPLVRRLQIQVPIRGLGSNGNPGRLDLLIDDWLDLELDGDAWHDRRADYARDSALARMGYLIHRFNFEQVVNSWETTEATVLELLRYPPRNRHGSS